jgi:hypothetical protein
MVMSFDRVLLCRKRLFEDLVFLSPFQDFLPSALVLIGWRYVPEGFVIAQVIVKLYTYSFERDANLLRARKSTATPCAFYAH